MASGKGRRIRAHRRIGGDQAVAGRACPQPYPPASCEIRQAAGDHPVLSGIKVLRCNQRRIRGVAKPADPIAGSLVGITGWHAAQMAPI